MSGQILLPQAGENMSRIGWRWTADGYCKYPPETYQANKPGEPIAFQGDCAWISDLLFCEETEQWQ